MGEQDFISSKYCYKKRDDLNISDSGNLESTFVEIIFPNHENIICGCIYKHPSMPIDQFVCTHLNPLLYKLNSINKNCILKGDFNIDLLKPKTSSEDYSNSLLSHFFFPFILQPTRITDFSKTLIENIFFNSLEYITYSGNITIEISDHLKQFLLL